VKQGERKGNRYSISVSGRTYDRLCAAVPRGSVASFVDDIVTSALDDASVLARLVDRCRYGDEAYS